jgi:hypothetical protein
MYRDLVADDTRTAQVVTDVLTALARGRHCLVLTQWTNHLDRLAAALRAHGHDPHLASEHVTGVAWSETQEGQTRHAERVPSTKHRPLRHRRFADRCRGNGLGRLRVTGGPTGAAGVVRPVDLGCS